MAQTAEILTGPQPKVTHSPPRPKAGKQMFPPMLYNTHEYEERVLPRRPTTK